MSVFWCLRNNGLSAWLRACAVCLSLSSLILARPCAAGGPPPVIVAQPTNQTVPNQGTATFAVTASSQTTLSYQWLKNGGKISHATSSRYTLANVGAGDAGTYSVNVVNGGGSVLSSNAILTVIVPPSMQQQPNNLTVSAGQTASFSATVNGSPPFGYQWRFDGAAISGATNTSLVLTNAQASQAGSYTAVITNLAGSVTSGVATLIVKAPPMITTQPQSETVVEPEGISFSVVAVGTPPLNYQWYAAGYNLGSEGNGSTFSVTNVGTNYAGTYTLTVVVQNSFGSVTSAPATLIILAPVEITTPPQSQTVAQGQSASFSIAASGSAPLSYQWNFDGSPLSGETNASLALTDVQGNQSGSYTAVVTNPAGSVTSLVATLTVDVPPTITTQPQSQTQPLGQNISFSVAAAGTAPLHYQWFFNGSKFSGVGTNSTLTFTNFSSTEAGSYTVVVTNNWGSATSAVATLTVAVPAGITTQPQSQGVVQGQSALFSVVASGTTPLNFQWYFDGSTLDGATNDALTLTNVQTTQAGNYTVVVTNNWGSITSAVATLAVYVPAGITSQPQSQAVVQGQSALFSVVASGTTPLNFQWYFDSSTLVGATNDALTLTNVQPTQAGNYTVVVQNNWGSVTSAVATLTVYIPPTITTQPQSQGVAQGQSALFSVVASGTTPLNFQWYFDSSTLVGATNDTLTLTNLQTNQAGSFTVVVTNNWGSVTSAVATLAVTNPPIVLSVPSGGQLTTNGFTLQFTGSVGATYLIQASTDMQVWTTISTNVATNGAVVFTDSAIASYPNRFYRVSEQ